MMKTKASGYAVTIDGDGVVRLEDVVCRDLAAAIGLARCWREGEEHETRCESEAAVGYEQRAYGDD